MRRFVLRHRAAAPALLTAPLTGGRLVPAGAGGGAGVRDARRAARPAAAASPAPAGRPLVVLLRDHVVHAAPQAAARRIATVAARRPLTHVRTVLPLLAAQGHWVHVRLPGRPNGHAGWISADATRRAATEWLVAVSLRTRQVRVYRAERPQARFSAVIAADSTPPHRRPISVEE